MVQVSPEASAYHLPTSPPLVGSEATCREQGSQGGMVRAQLRKLEISGRANILSFDN
jgi:hypothetical protein